MARCHLRTEIQTFWFVTHHATPPTAPDWDHVATGTKIEICLNFKHWFLEFVSPNKHRTILSVPCIGYTDLQTKFCYRLQRNFCSSQIIQNK